MVEQKSKTMYKKDISGSNQFYSANGNTRSVLQTKSMEKISLLQQLAYDCQPDFFSLARLSLRLLANPKHPSEEAIDTKGR